LVLFREFADGASESEQSTNLLLSDANPIRKSALKIVKGLGILL